MKRLVVVGCLALACMSLAGGLLHAGSTTGAGVYKRSCPAFGETVIWEEYFSDEVARLTLVGDGDTDLDIYVYDSLGRLVALGIGPTDREQVSFVPFTTGSYRIVIRNLGQVYNRFQLHTN